MLLYFEDWTPFLGMLDKNRTDHGHHLLKVIPTEKDPTTIFSRKDIYVANVDDQPLTEEEVFVYEGRGHYPGSDLEEFARRITQEDAVLRKVRALFRFANSEELKLAQTGMGLHNFFGGWLISHPFQEIDGLMDDPPTKGRLERVHLDIFNTVSLQRVTAMLGVVSLADTPKIVSYEEMSDRIRADMARRK